MWWILIIWLLCGLLSWVIVYEKDIKNGDRLKLIGDYIITILWYLLMGPIVLLMIMNDWGK